MLSLSCALLLAGCVGGDDTPDDPYTDGSAGSSGGGAGRAGSGAKAGSGGSAGKGGSDLEAGAVDSHFPLAAGASWTYQHRSSDKDPWDEVATMSATTYQGQPAFILEDQEDDEGAQTRSTLVVQDTGVYRAYREVRVNDEVALQVAYAPAFLRYDEAWSVVGQSDTLDDDWKQTCVFTSVASKCAPGAVQTGKTTHVYKVVDLAAQIEVPAGKFETVEVERYNPDARETRRFWFAAGVGKVKEEDVESGASEELSAFTLPK